MQLVGMLDSPFVRRVAISLRLLGLRFEHRSVSVFRTFTQFQRMNPVVKAPTLVCDDDEVLMAAANYPFLAALSAKAEALREFRAAPYGESTYQHVE